MQHLQCGRPAEGVSHDKSAIVQFQTAQELLQDVVVINFGAERGAVGEGSIVEVCEGGHSREALANPGSNRIVKQI